MHPTQLDFQQAKANHLLFKSRLRALLYGETPEHEAAVLSQYACTVGKWIYGHALIVYETVPEVYALEKVHARMHIVARELISLYRQGKINEARQGLDRIEQIADELVHLLDMVETSVLATDTPGEPSPTSQDEDNSATIFADLLEKNLQLDAKIKAQSAELASKESFFSALMAISPVALWQSDASGSITYASQTWIDWTGKPFSAHLGHGWAESIIPEDRIRSIRQFSEDVAARRPYTIDFRIRRQNGAVLWCAVAGKPWYTPEGTFGGYVGSGTDVTEQRRAEQELHEKTENERQTLHDFFMQAPAAHCILRGPNHVYELINPGYRELIGDRDLLGKSVREAHPDVEGQGFFDILDRVFTTREAFIGREVPFSLDKGQGVRKAAYVNFIYQPILNRHEETDGILVFAYEVTEQVAARQRIEVSEARFRSLIEEAPIATALLLGREMMIEVANKPQLAVWAKGDAVMNKPLAQVLPEMQGQPLLRILDEVFTTGKVYAARNDRADLMIDGELRTFYFDFTFKPLRNTQGEVYAILTMGVDVTEQVLSRKQLEASEERFRILSTELDQQVQQRTRELAATNTELTRSNQLLTRSNENLQQFTYVASHDLQEPLRKIQSFGDLLQRQYADQLGDGVEHLQRMQAAATRMSTLIRDLLTFSRISTRQEATDPVSLTQVVDTVLMDLELIIQETRAVITVEPLPTILGNPSQLEQLFQNLLSNALKFHRTDQSGTPVIPMVRIISRLVAAVDLPTSVKPTRQAAVYHCIGITDNGIGFDEKHLNRIFQVFQRLHGRLEFPGTGIGLAICERVATNHGGAITAGSQPGQGATFSVYFPVSV